jgi:hypothetical protein
MFHRPQSLLHCHFRRNRHRSARVVALQENVLPEGVLCTCSKIDWRYRGIASLENKTVVAGKVYSRYDVYHLTGGRGLIAGGISKPPKSASRNRQHSHPKAEIGTPSIERM